MEIDNRGWLHADGALVRHAASPNCDERPDARDICLVVVHAISLPPGEFGGDAIEHFFCNELDATAHPYFETIKALRVSAHVLIRRDGCLVQFVSFDKRAWHAGASNWRGRERCNDFSIGIELEGCDELAFDDAQYRTLNILIESIAARYALQGVVGHSDIAPGRKTDPGPCFDWTRVSWLVQ